MAFSEDMLSEDSDLRIMSLAWILRICQCHFLGAFCLQEHIV